tara:strand:+ start:146 stop:331 length:186 start_codon:yes stop_codon:yes gene_type:complete
MPMGKGTYGSKMGRPPKKDKKNMMGGGRMNYMGGSKVKNGNASARRERKMDGGVMETAKPN